MKRTHVAALFVAAALLLGSVSQNVDASVIYRWHPVNDKVPNTYPGLGACCFDLWLEVTDEAFNAGSMNYDYGGYADPESPIVEFFSSTAFMTPPLGNYQPWTWVLETDVQFSDYLTGSMHVNDGQVSYYMDTRGRSLLWTVWGFRADDPGWGCYYRGCSGATGYWAVDSAPSPVPEPDLFPMFGLLAAGLLGVDTARRWRRAQHR